MKKPIVFYNTLGIQINEGSGNIYPLTISSTEGVRNPSAKLEIDVNKIEQEYGKKIANEQTSDQLFSSLGKQLHDCLFTQNVAEAFEVNWAVARTQKTKMSGVRINLRIMPTASELDDIPWEYMFYPSRNLWLGATVSTPFHHYVDGLPSARTKIKPPLKILIATAASLDMPRLNVRGEVNRISKILHRLIENKLIEIEVSESTTRKKLEYKLRTIQPHILHFIGHGRFEHDPSGLYLEDDDGHGDFVDEDIFVSLLEHFNSVKMIILNACSSYSIARSLAKNGIVTIGMRYPIIDEAAKLFSEGFYTALSNGEPVDLAVNRARFQIRYNYNSASRDWGSIILYLPQGNPDIFDIQTPTFPDTDKEVPIPHPSEGRLSVWTTPATTGVEIQYFNSENQSYSRLGVTNQNGRLAVKMRLGVYHIRSKTPSSNYQESPIEIVTIGKDETAQVNFLLKPKSRFEILISNIITRLRKFPNKSFAFSGVLFLLVAIGLGYDHYSATRVPEGMVRIPAGKFIKGSEDTHLLRILRKYRDEFTDITAIIKEAPHEGYIQNGFYIDKYEVTNEQYHRFVQTTGRRSPAHWGNGRIPSGEENYPVVNVSWYDARAYAKWAGKRLPTADEWERTARGTDGRLFPWGNEFDVNKCNTAESTRNSLIEATAYPHGQSPEGVYNMVGNVWEWTNERYTSDGEAFGRVVKGGSYLRWCEIYGLTFFNLRGAQEKYISLDLGFRCAIDEYRDDQPPDNMIFIPSGKFLKGSKDSYVLNLVREQQLTSNSFRLLIEAEPDTLYMEEFFIDKYEVTNTEYRDFLQAVGKDRSWSHPDEPDSKSREPTGFDNKDLNSDHQPVVGIDWHDAFAYAKWIGKRLPTDNEWEKAARNTDGRFYPWGNEFDEAKYYGGKDSESSTVNVHDFESKSSAYGIAAMAGNASEWIDASKKDVRVIRGGAWSDNFIAVHGLTFVRLAADPTYRKEDVGFRCVKDRRYSWIEKLISRHEKR